MQEQKAVVIVSGGMDSSVLLAKMRSEGNVSALTFDYGQRHKREIACAILQAASLEVPHKVIDARRVFEAIGGSCLVDLHHSVPHGHYAESNMKRTVVPNRNMILLSIAIGVAVSTHSTHVAYAAHAGDHAIYPDCRPEFATELAKLALIANWSPIVLERPFIDKTKSEIVSLGASLGVDFATTWSCYEGGDLACGRCGTCVERLEAFDLAGVTDPLNYKDREFWKERCK